MKPNTENHESTFTLLKHTRRASNFLNLIRTTNNKNGVKRNPVLRNNDIYSFFSCGTSWKVKRSKSRESVKYYLGYTLRIPGETQWNSIYHAAAQILTKKEKPPRYLIKWGLRNFKEPEILYLEKYCIVIKPLVAKLDLLQGENSPFSRFLLPRIVSLINKYKKVLVWVYWLEGQGLLT